MAKEERPLCFIGGPKGFPAQACYCSKDLKMARDLRIGLIKSYSTALLSKRKRSYAFSEPCRSVRRNYGAAVEAWQRRRLIRLRDVPTTLPR